MMQRKRQAPALIHKSEKTCNKILSENNSFNNRQTEKSNGMYQNQFCRVEALSQSE